MNQDLRNQALAEAFQTFSQMSEQLELAYRELEQRVARLNEELADARSTRVRELNEKARLVDRLQALLETLPAGVLVLDGVERVREFNRVALDQLGAPLLGEHWSVITARAFRLEESRGAELALRDGRRVNIASRSLDTEPGRILVLQDVTDARDLLERTSRQQRLSALGEMAASLAHQIRTPLSAAMLYASHLAREQLPLGDRARFADRLSDRLRSLERLVNDMLSFARGGSAGAEHFTLGELVADLEAVIETQLQVADARWHTHLDAPNALIAGNKEALLGALGNLVNNSLQMIPGIAELELVAGRTADGEIELRLRDNGPGVPEDVRERLFDPFFTTRPGGTGLGLAVVQATLRAHRGDVQLASSPGGGAEFVLRLPDAMASANLPSGLCASYLTAASVAPTAVCGIN